MKRPVLIVSALGLALTSMACSSSSSSSDTGKGGTTSGSSTMAPGGSSSASSPTTSAAGSGGNSSAAGGTSSSSRSSGGASTTASGGVSTSAGGTSQTSKSSGGSAAGGTSTGGAGGAGTSTTAAGGTGGRTTGAGGTTNKGGTTSNGGSNGGTTSTGGGTAVPDAIYVSPEGDDSNAGTLDKPLKTIEKARDLVRTKIAGMTSDLTVYLRGGTYPAASTITFGSADSGKGGFYVKYMAYPNERPLITGGKPLTGWKDAGNGLFSVDAGSTAFRQMYVNGVKAIRARTPNLSSGSAGNFNRLSGWDKNAHNVQVPSTAVGEWKNLNKVEMHIMIAWGDSAMRISSISTTGNTAYIKFMPDEDGIVFIRPNPRMDQVGWGNGRAYYFENAMEFLDQAGEWYLDETTHTVYYKPRSGEDMATATVIVPVVETIMSVKGTSTSDQASYLWFQGLTFAHATWMRPSEHGFLDGQAFQYNLSSTADNKQYVARPPAGVMVSNANHLHLERNLFTQMGATGLDFVSGTHDNMIVGNAITDIAGTGFSIGKFTADEKTEFHVPYNPSDKNEICSKDTFKNNLIDRVTTEFQGAVGIGAGYPANLTIEHNEISHTNYTGISVGYGWTSAVNAMTNNKINYNNIHHVNEIMTDGGAIYTLSNQGPASEMQYNYIHDYQCSQWADYGCNGLYMDEQTAGYTVAHNVMVNCPTNVARNQNGQDTVTDNGANPQGADNTKATAGIEPTYTDIKKLTVPAAKF